MLMMPCKIKCTYYCHPGSILENHSKGLKLPRWGIFGLPSTQRVKILEKSKPNTSTFTRHTSHSTYGIWILSCIWNWTIQTHKTIKKLVPPNISWWKETLFQNIGFCEKSKNSKNFFTFFKSNLKKLRNQQSKNITLTVFST